MVSTTFFFNATATTEIYTLSLHDALPIYAHATRGGHAAAMIAQSARSARAQGRPRAERAEDRKSTRLNSSHSQISYAVFCLKKKIVDRFNDGQLQNDESVVPVALGLHYGW